MAMPRSSSALVSSVGSARTRTASPRSCSAETTCRPTNPLPPVTRTSFMLGPVGRAIPLDAAPDAFGEVDLRCEPQLAPRAGDGEPVLATQELHAVAHHRWRLLPMTQSPEALGACTQHEAEAVGNAPLWRRRTQLDSNGMDVIPLGYRLIIDEEVRLARGLTDLACK